jgi:RND family efflux transporter MFP subunit
MKGLMRIGWLPGLVAASAALAGCNPASAPPGAVEPPPPEVKVSLPATREVTDYEDFPGRIEAVYAIDLRARATGYLERVNFTEGADVERGDLLFEIDPRQYQAELNRAEATLIQAQAHLARLEQDYQRAVNILPRGGMSREEFDKIAGDRAEASAAVGVARANRDLAALNLSYTKVRSPISGRISRRYLDPGNMVKADDTILTSIVSLDPVFVYFDLDERTTLHFQRLIRDGKISWSTGRPCHATALTAPLALLAAVAQYRWHQPDLVARVFDWTTNAGLPVLVGLADEPGFDHHGTINFADNRVDPDTGTWRLRGKFFNPDHVLSPGLFVRVRLPIGTPYRATLVAEQALATDQGQKVVWVLTEDNRVESRDITIGRQHDGQRVILKGVQPGERVVVSGLQRLQKGMRVAPKLIDMPAGNPKSQNTNSKQHSNASTETLNRSQGSTKSGH